MAKQVKALNINDSVALESDMGSKLNQSAAAPEFLTTEDYPAGYHVTRNGNLYKFTSDHPAGAWTGEDVILEDMTTPDAMLDLTSAGYLRVVAADGTIMWVQNTLSVSRDEIADDFSASKAYSPPDLVVYNNVLYKCTAAHAAGAWDESHFAVATVEEVLEAIRTEMNGKAPVASPTFTGTPTAPTPTSGDNSTKIATTAFVSTAISGKAPLASPSFTGTPTAPTPASSDNSTKIATTAFVKSAISQISFQPLAGQTMPESPTQRELTAAVKLIFTALGGTIGGGGGGGSYTLNSDGTVSTEGTLNNDGTLTVEGTLNNDGTLTVEAS